MFYANWLKKKAASSTKDVGDVLFDTIVTPTVTF
ncbi:hypothetical protein [Sporisorium scitamineum]|uniref:Uncharacterized protein n=1 Tax=Sporisorium scitamineum TaxID=49012 RepID=A0A0F7RVV0_9BASI|nr:hypothetical protein [Sporisorium scitamineum]